MKITRPTLSSLKDTGLTRYFLAVIFLALGSGYGSAQAHKFAGSPATGAAVSEAVSIPVSQSGTIASVSVVSGGVSQADFTADAASGDTCAASASVTAGDTCSLNVKFSPKGVGERRGAVVLKDGAGNVLGSAEVYGKGAGSVMVMLPAEMHTVAGNGQWLYKPMYEDLPATQSPLFLPGGVAIDPSGNLYISDSSNNRVRRVDAITHLMKTIAGDGNPGFARDGQDATTAQLSNPGALVLNGAGDLYIADSSNHAIRKLNIATGKLTTVAGQLATPGFSGDGGPATLATLNTPEGLALDADGNLYIADTGNQVIRKLDIATGAISTVVGTPRVASFAGDGGDPTHAKLNTPWGITFDAQGALYIADLSNSRIRKVSSGVITTVAGNASTDLGNMGLLATATMLKDPAAVLVDAAGNIYIADSGHNRVIKVNAQTKIVSLAAGDALQTELNDGRAATIGSLYGPYALTPDSQGNIYIADIFHHRIRVLQNSLDVLKYDPIRVGRTSPAQKQIVENDGTTDLHWIVMNPDANSTFDPANSTCVASGTVAVNATCTIAVQFMPQTTGSQVHANFQMLADAVNSPGTLDLFGESDALEPTSTIIAATPNPSAVGSVVTVTASVSGGGTPSGTVKFYDGTTLLGSAQTDSSHVATFSLSALTLGSHTLKAAFTGDATNEPSSSPDLIQVVKQNPAMTLVSQLNPAKVGQNVTVVATVAATPNMPTGNVVFMEDSAVLGTVNLDGSGIASLPLHGLRAGHHNITAQYAGDTNNLPATSNVLDEEVDLWASSATLGSNNNPADLGTAVTLSAQVTSIGGDAPTGAVTFLDGSTTLGTVSLNPQGIASFTTSSLTVGTHTITASYAGDGSNDVSTSSSLAQKVQKISTTTTLASSLNPANGGASIRFTAAVNASLTNSTAGTLSGAVMFTEGTTTLGSGALSTNGTATLDLSTLGVGTHNIVATYVGNNGYAASSSASFAETVQLATTTVQVSSSAPTSTAGNNVVLTAVVNGDGGMPTGAVTFLDGTRQIGTGTLNSSGQASITVNNLTSGSHTITVQYAGDTKSKPSTSAPLNQVIQVASTGVTLASSSNPAISGTAISFAAAVSSSGSIPAGSLRLMEGATVLGTGVISQTGSVQFSVSGLSAGSHNITASFAGDADHANGESAVLVQVVKLGDTSIAVVSSANPSAAGSSVTFTAKVTGNGPQPAGSVSFTDGVTVIGSGVLNAAGTASFSTTTLALGQHTISANYAGDANHNASTPTAVAQVVQQTTATSITSDLNPSLVGDTITFTAQVTGASGQPVSGAVQFFDGGSNLGTATIANAAATLKVSTLAAGSHIITAKYLGDNGSQASTSATLAQGVNTADTTVMIASNTNPATVGTPIVFTATVQSKGKAPTGTVAFVEGGTILATATINNGIATASVNTLQAGQHAIVARYNGDSGTQVSNSPVLLETVQQTTSVVLTSSLNPALTAQGMTLSATVTGSNPSGTITFLDGAKVIGTAALVNGNASMQIAQMSAGTHALTASYGGDNYNLASVSPQMAEIVMIRPSTTSMTASAQTYKAGEQITLVAVVKTVGPVPPTGTVTFTMNGQSIGTGTVSTSGAATLVFAPSAPRYDIVAQYNGDGVYMPSTASTYTIQIGNTTTFSLTTDPPSLSMASGDHATVNLSVVANASFTDTVLLGCLDLPEEATCTFSAPSVKLSGGEPATASVVIDTGLPLGAGPRAPGQGSIVWPAAVLMGLLVMLRRRALTVKMASLVAMLVLLVTSAGITGCASSISVKSTPPGTYNVRIIATGSGTGVSQVANVQVTVK